MSDFSGITDEMINQYQPMIYKIIGSRSIGGGLSTEEKYSAGLLGVLTGLHTYDPTRETPLQIWIYRNILYAIHKEAKRRFEWTIHEISLPESWELEEWDHRPEPLVDASEFLATVMRRLSDRERRILTALMGGKTQEEVARDEETTQGTICRIRRIALKRLSYKRVLPHPPPLVSPFRADAETP
ncbi:MAG: sigma-70 family RNA polymerase sigma factor [Thermoguttaceae bacterium]|nr:sigma-70 family RNA polymerase sigma factor [Thermoguttaceae bacterium]